MATSKQQWSGAAIEAALAAQGIALAQGRAERLARGQQALLGASAADPLLAALDFHADPTTFLLIIQRTK